MAWLIHIKYSFHVSVSTTIYIHSVMVFSAIPGPNVSHFEVYRLFISGKESTGIWLVNTLSLGFGNRFGKMLGWYNINIKVGPAWNLCRIML